ncbi:MAG: aminotransferase class IV [Verrucomicrobiota bacterium]|nr:aminotransferase class IV [Verrucomicrobiota bacterium]
METILWTRKDGYLFLKEHLDRAERTQFFFKRKWNRSKVLEILNSYNFLSEKSRVRLLADEFGNIQLESFPLEKIGWFNDSLKILLSRKRTDPDNPFLRHKTTNRYLYNNSYKNTLKKGFDEVIFENLSKNITEGAISNIFIRVLDDNWQTPPVKCGLLPGIWRDKMITKLSVSEKILTSNDLAKAKEILIGNSVKGTGKVTEIRNFSDKIIFKK